jgi:hypothetical protein
VSDDLLVDSESPLGGFSLWRISTGRLLLSGRGSGTFASALESGVLLAVLDQPGGYSLKLIDGLGRAVVWQRPLSDRLQLRPVLKRGDSAGNFTHQAPIETADRILVLVRVLGHQETRIAAYSTAGKALWLSECKDVGFFYASGGMATALLDEAGSRRITALSSETGETLWEIEAMSRSGPALPFGDLVIQTIGTSPQFGNLRLLDSRSGRVVEQFDHVSSGNTITLHEETSTVYLTRSGTVYAITRNEAKPLYPGELLASGGDHLLTRVGDEIVARSLAEDGRDWTTKVRKSAGVCAIGLSNTFVLADGDRVRILDRRTGRLLASASIDPPFIELRRCSMTGVVGLSPRGWQLLRFDLPRELPPSAPGRLTRPAR